MSFCPTQVSKGVEFLDRSLVLHEKKRQDDIRRSPLQLSNCRSSCKFETRNKIETVVASRVLMSMELVEVENANRLCFFYIGWLIIKFIFTLPKTTSKHKNPLQSKDFQRENLTLWSKTKEQRLIIEGLYRHQALYARLLCKVAAKGKHAAAEHVLGIAPGKCHAETRDQAGDLQIFSLTLSQLSYRGSVQNCRCCWSRFVHLGVILIWGRG